MDTVRNIASNIEVTFYEFLSTTAVHMYCEHSLPVHIRKVGQHTTKAHLSIDIFFTQCLSVDCTLAPIVAQALNRAARASER